MPDSGQPPALTPGSGADHDDGVYFDSSLPSEVWSKDSRLGAASARAHRRAGPSPGVPAGSPLFCLNLLHDFDFQIALGQQLFEPGVLVTQRFQLLDIGHLHPVVEFAPPIDRLLDVTG